MDIRTEIANLDNESVRGLLEGIVPDNTLNSGDSTVLLALTGDSVCGFLVFSAKEDCIVLASIYVYEEYRRQGVATYLLDSFGMLMWIKEYQYPILMYIPDEEECAPLLSLMRERFDYFVSKACDCVQVSYNQIRDSEILQKIISISKKDMPLLFDLPTSMRRAEFQGNRAFQYIGDGLKSDGQDYCRDLCFCDYQENEIKGFVLVRRWDEKTLNLEYMFSNNAKSTSNLLANLGNKILKDYPGFSLCVSAINEASESLVTKIFEEKTVFGQYRASWNGLIWSEAEELI